MTNNAVAEKVYEDHGEVGFWYFYKDAVKSHLNTVWTYNEHFEIQGIKMIALGIFYIGAAIAQLLLMITSPVWIPLKHIRKARKASKKYREWLESRN